MSLHDWPPWIRPLFFSSDWFSAFAYPYDHWSKPLHLSISAPLNMKKPALAKFKNTIVFLYSVSSIGISIYNLTVQMTSTAHVIPVSQHHSDYTARAARVSSRLCIGPLYPPPLPCYPVHCAQFLLHRLVGLCSGQPFPRVLLPLQLRIRAPIPMTRTSSQMIKENRMNRA